MTYFYELMKSKTFREAFKKEYKALRYGVPKRRAEMTEREKYVNGAFRDKRDGKGRYDLISPFAMKRLAIVMEEGANHYADRNWENGINIGRYVDSALRHIVEYMLGDTSEDKLGHAMFNIMAIMHTQEMIEKGALPAELADMPDYAPKAELGADWGRGTAQTVTLDEDCSFDVYNCSICGRELSSEGETCYHDAGGVAQ